MGLEENVVPMPRFCEDKSIVVVKIGGSVLRDLHAYRRCAQWLVTRRSERPQDRLVVVVSARHGVTDELLRLAEEVSPVPDHRALDLLWSTGELQSVALLTLCLHDAGVGAVGLNVHELGLTLSDRAVGAGGTRLNALRLQAALARDAIVVVPGFLARGPGDVILSLGRGGSDLTAVRLAVALGATCELVKDVPGYFTSDPNRDVGARPIPVLDSAAALEMEAAGCELVQRQALEAAADAHVPVIIRSLDTDAPSTLVRPPASGRLSTSRATVAPVAESPTEDADADADVYPVWAAADGVSGGHGAPPLR